MNGHTLWSTTLDQEVSPPEGSTSTTMEGWRATTQAGNGRVVVGRHLPEEDEEYAGVDVDELLLFNNNMNDDQINAIYNQQN